MRNLCLFLLIFFSQVSEASLDCSAYFAFESKTLFESKKLLESGQNEKAKSLLIESLSKYPNTASLRILLVKILITQNQKQLAQEYLDWFFQLERPLNVEAVNLNQRLLEKREALAWIRSLKTRRWFRQSPNYHQLIIIESKLLAKIGETRNGIKLLNKALVNRPENIDLLFALAQAHRNMMNKDEALIALREILRLEPKNSKAIGIMSSILMYQGNLSEALALINQLPEGLEKAMRLGAFYVHIENWTEAIRVLSPYKGDRIVDWKLSLAFYGLGDMNSAYRTLLRMSQNTGIDQDRVLAALVKIESQRANNQELGPVTQSIQGSENEELILRLAGLQLYQLWTYSPTAVNKDSSSGSAFNNIYDGLNSRPADRQAVEDIFFPNDN